jgi:hypothetical protein
MLKIKDLMKKIIFLKNGLLSGSILETGSAGNRFAKMPTLDNGMDIVWRNMIVGFDLHIELREDTLKCVRLRVLRDLKILEINELDNLLNKEETEVYLEIIKIRDPKNIGKKIKSF